MKKIRYKEPSDNFKKISNKISNSQLRISLGREREVKEYHLIPINDLIIYEKQSRRIFDSDEIEQLAATIREYGIITPLQILACKSELGKFSVVSGERRLRAAKLIGLDKVPCIIIKDEEKSQEVALIENIQRIDLHPIELANGLLSLMNFYQWGDVSKLAEKIGKTQSTISEHLSYARLPTEIKNYIIDNNVRSRDLLRKLLLTQEISEMYKILGIEKIKTDTYPKSILRIKFEDGLFHLQGKSILRLNVEDQRKLKKTLLSLVSRLDKLINNSKNQ